MLIVEDGTGTLAAESYASVAEADQYMSDRGKIAWAALVTGDKESALRRATDYMMQMYRDRWGGTRVTNTQKLDWPRYLVPMKDAPGAYRSLPAYYLYTIVPIEVKAACIQLALRASTAELLDDLQPPTTNETVGAISISKAVGARQTIRYAAIDYLLSPMLKDGGTGSLVALRRG